MHRFLRITECRRVLFLVLACGAIVPSGGCADVVERRWSEVVDIGSGKTIVVDRSVHFRGSNSLSGDAYSSTNLSSKLVFTNDLSNLPPWEGPLVALVLYFDESAGEWVVVAATYSCDTWAELGSPAPPYWEYRLKGGKWTLTPLSENSLGRESNLFFHFEPPLPSNYLSLELKAQVLQKNHFAREYRGIWRDSKSNCTRRIK
jgi:hypothetical protein